MRERTLAKATPEQSFFARAKKNGFDDSDLTAKNGSKELRPLDPFVISGGENTERFYFQHISSLTDFKFNVQPKYFGKESQYSTLFPKKIREIIKDNPDAKIFCVYDLDTIYGGSEKSKRNYEEFQEKIKPFVESGQVELCPSMPCFEYWLYLHFDSNIKWFKNCSSIIKVLEPLMKPYFPEVHTELSNIIKKQKYLQSSEWVKQLCSGKKLDKAVKNAKKIHVSVLNQGKEEELSHSLVYKMFK